MNKTQFDALSNAEKWAHWQKAPLTERAALVDNSALHAPFVGLEGARVKVYQLAGGTRSFNIGKSNGWQPCHLEIARVNSTGGACLYVDFDKFEIVRGRA